MVPKSRTNQDLREIEIFPQVPWEVQRGGREETGLVPKVHWRIADERERREHNLAAYHIELLRQTKTGEGFSAWLLQLREHLETVSKWQMMKAWPEPHDWPGIDPDDLSRDIGPRPEQKYRADRRWVRGRFLQLQRWGHVRDSEGIKLRWHEARGQLWFLDPQREGEALIDQILERKASETPESV